MSILQAPKVAIVILNWNQYADTADCLLSLQGIDYPNYKVFLIDNGSIDGSGERIKQDFNYINLIKNKKNLGFTGANNIGIKAALEDDAEYILILNNDTTVESHFLNELVAVAEKEKEAAIIGPTVCYFSEPGRIWFSKGKINPWTGHAVCDDAGRTADGLSEGPKEADYIGGCSMLIKSEKLKQIGFFDERFFIYFEESDLCMRAKEAGFKVIYVPRAKIWHKISRAMGLDTPRVNYFYTRNRFLFAMKHGKFFHKFIFTFNYFYNDIFKRLLFLSLRGRLAEARAVITGLRDFLFMNFGDAPF